MNAARRRPGLWALVVAGALLAALAAGAPPGDGAPLDPSSTGPLGARGLVLVLEELGIDVDVSTQVPSAGQGREGTTRLLVLDDRLSEAQHDDLSGWVEAGGVLVVADPGSSLHGLRVTGATGTPLGGASIPRDHCTVGALDGTERVDPSGGVRFAVPATATSCFGDSDEAFVVADRHGDGTVVAVGGAGALTNSALGTFDNAGLATGVLVGPGTERVVVLRGAAAGEGDKGLWDLVGRNVRDGLAQLLVAFVVVALWRARRLGRPVTEPAPVEVPGSELTVAVGNLLARAGTTQHAADLIRAGLRRDLGERFGLPRSTDAATLAVVLAERTATDPHALAAVLADAPIGDDAALLALARDAEGVRAALLSPLPNRRPGGIG